jgi:AraC family transcriptional activator of pobA
MKEKIRTYDVSAVAKEVGLQEIKGIAVNRSADAVRIGLTDHPHLVDGIICAICIKGYAKLKINFQEKELKPGTLMVVLPDSMMDPIDISNDLHINTIFFSYDLIMKTAFVNDFDLLEKISNNPCQLLDDDYFELFQAHHTAIVTHYYRKQEKGKKDVLTYLLCALVADVQTLYTERDYINKKISRQDQLTNAFFQYLMKHYKEERNISFYADKMNLTPKYLTTAIRKQTGKSISGWITEAVITHAKSILKTTDTSIQEITDLLNFSDISLFCRYFKRYTNMTPSEYRKQN